MELRIFVPEIEPFVDETIHLHLTLRRLCIATAVPSQKPIFRRKPGNVRPFQITI
jgi:hypothetical protein